MTDKPKNEADQFANLPPALATKHAELLAAMTQPKDPRSQDNEWPLDEKLAKAYAPEAVAKIIMHALPAHNLIRNRSFAFLWRPEMSRNGKTILGKASVAAGKVKYFGDVDFIIDINWSFWSQLTPFQRCALIDHELCHCTIDADTQKPKMVAHDIEEFGSIVKRWGFWKPDVELFAAIMSDAKQLSLLPQGAPEKPKGKAKPETTKQQASAAATPVVPAAVVQPQPSVQ